MKLLLKLAVFILPVIFTSAGLISADTPAPLPANPGVTETVPGAGNQTGADLEAMTDIIDIKANEAIGFDYRMVYIILAVIGSLALVALIIYLIDRFIKKRRKKDLPDHIPVPAWDRARQDLEDLEKTGCDDARIFYFTLTAIVKAYLEGRFGIGAPEMTTEELLPEINHIPIDKSQANDVKELLRRSDPVKFAGLDERKEQMVHDIDFVKAFVTRTTPDEQDLVPSGNE